MRRHLAAGLAVGHDARTVSVGTQNALTLLCFDGFGAI